MSGITLTQVPDTDIPTPATGKDTLFMDVATGEPSYKDDAGTVTSLQGAVGQGVPAGGTTSQVLAKINATDYNTQWVAPGMTNPMTTAEDIIIGGVAGAPARVAIGANGTFLGVVAGALTYTTPSGSGDVVGPASAVDDRIATFDTTTGKLIQDGGKTIADLRIPSIQAVTSSATVTPTFADDMVKITAQAAGLTLANPTGTAIPGLGIVIRIKDNGTARAIAYGSQYRAIGITLPATTVISKTTYIAMIYNSDDTTWDCVATGTQA